MEATKPSRHRKSPWMNEATKVGTQEDVLQRVSSVWRCHSRDERPKFMNT